MVAVIITELHLSNLRDPSDTYYSFASLVLMYSDSALCHSLAFNGTGMVVYTGWAALWWQSPQLVLPAAAATCGRPEQIFTLDSYSTPASA